MPARHGRDRGFTLIELLITVVIIGILAAIGMPAFSSFVAGQRIKTASFDVMSTMILARSEALKRNQDVTVTSTSGTNWANGWSVTVDGTTLKQQSAFKNLNITTIPATSNLSYNNSGRLSTVEVKFSISGTGSSVTSRCISIDLSGRPNSKLGACS